MNYLQIDNLTKSYGIRLLFTDISFTVNEGEKIGLIAKNGTGKTTLLRIIAGEEAPDSGSVILRSGVRMGYLPQQPAFPADSTPQSIADSFADDDERQQFIRLLTQMELTDMQAPVENMSGGQRKRLALAQVIARNPQLLILDEPTNHLDINTVEWLENYLSRSRMTLLMVTHDRYFLDRVTNRIIEIDRSAIFSYDGNYDYYLRRRAERIEAMGAELARVRNTLRKEQDWMSRQPQARGTKPKFRKDAALELIANDPPVRQSIELRRSAVSRLGKKVINLKNAAVSFGGREVIKPLEWNIGAGDRIGILGSNGVGKTTLLQLVQGKLKPTRGRVEIGQTVKMAVLDQQLSELKEIEGDFVREVIGRYKTRYELDDGREVSPSQLLQELGFDSAQLNCPVRDLSGVQRRRL